VHVCNDITATENTAMHIHCSRQAISAITTKRSECMVSVGEMLTFLVRTTTMANTFLVICC